MKAIHGFALIIWTSWRCVALPAPDKEICIGYDPSHSSRSIWSETTCQVHGYQNDTSFWAYSSSHGNETVYWCVGRIGSTYWLGSSCGLNGRTRQFGFYLPARMQVHVPAEYGVITMNLCYNPVSWYTRTKILENCTSSYWTKHWKTPYVVLPISRLPTEAPTARPLTPSPSTAPSQTQSPSSRTPTKEPSNSPSEKPTANPSRNPTSSPSSKPSTRPTDTPTTRPTNRPTSNPTSRSPSNSPTRSIKPSTTTREPRRTVVTSFLMSNVRNTDWFLKQKRNLCAVLFDTLNQQSMRLKLIVYEYCLWNGVEVLSVQHRRRVLQNDVEITVIFITTDDESADNIAKNISRNLNNITADVQQHITQNLSISLTTIKTTGVTVQTNFDRRTTGVPKQQLLNKSASSRQTYLIVGIVLAASCVFIFAIALLSLFCKKQLQKETEVRVQKNLQLASISSGEFEGSTVVSNDVTFTPAGPVDYTLGRRADSMIFDTPTVSPRPETRSSYSVSTVSKSVETPQTPGTIVANSRGLMQIASTSYSSTHARGVSVPVVDHENVFSAAPRHSVDDIYFAVPDGILESLRTAADKK